MFCAWYDVPGHPDAVLGLQVEEFCHGWGLERGRDGGCGGGAAEEWSDENVPSVVTVERS